MSKPLSIHTGLATVKAIIICSVTELFLVGTLCIDILFEASNGTVLVVNNSIIDIPDRNFIYIKFVYRSPVGHTEVAVGQR